MNTVNKISDRGIKGVFMAGAAASIMLLAAAVMVGPGAAQARSLFGTARSPEQALSQMKERLSLTEEQEAAIRPVLEEKARKRIELMDNGATDRRAIRTEMKKLKWETEMKLGEILTEDQKARYIELRQEQRENRHRGKGFGGWTTERVKKSPEQVVARLVQRLDLTDGQTAAIGPIIREGIEKKQVILDKYRIQGLNVRQSMRDEMRAAGDETHAKLSAVLTEEQMEKLNTMREERRSRRDKWGQGLK